MKVAFLLLLFGRVAFAAIAVDHYQDFHTGTNSTLLSTGVLARSSIGAGRWEAYQDGVAFQSWTITNLPAFTYPVPLSVGGTNIYNTGTNAIVYDMNTANAVEEARWFPPGAQYQYSNLLISFFINMGAVPTGADKNYDHIHMTGGYFCVCQQQISSDSGYNRIISHSQNFEGSTNGAAVNIDRTAWYFVQMLRDFTRKRCAWKIYDATTFALVGSSEVGMGTTAASDNYPAQVVRVSAHYLNQQPGTTTLMGISVSYVDPQLDFFDLGTIPLTNAIASGKFSMNGKVVMR